MNKFIKNEENKKILLNDYEIFIGFARDNERDKLEMGAKEDGGIDNDYQAAKFAQALINVFRMLFII